MIKVFLVLTFFVPGEGLREEEYSVSSMEYCQGVATYTRAALEDVVPRAVLVRCDQREVSE